MLEEVNILYAGIENRIYIESELNQVNLHFQLTL